VTTTTPSIQGRIAALDWAAMTRDLDNFGCTIVKSVLTREECRSLAAMFELIDNWTYPLAMEAMILLLKFRLEYQIKLHI